MNKANKDMMALLVHENCDKCGVMEYFYKPSPNRTCFNCLMDANTPNQPDYELKNWLLKDQNRSIKDKLNEQ